MRVPDHRARTVLTVAAIYRAVEFPDALRDPAEAARLGAYLCNLAGPLAEDLRDAREDEQRVRRMLGALDSETTFDAAKRVVEVSREYRLALDAERAT